MGINVGTSGRSKCGSIGLEKYQSVVLANGMAERTGWVLIIELQNFYSLFWNQSVNTSSILEDCFIMLIDILPFWMLGS